MRCIWLFDEYRLNIADSRRNGLRELRHRENRDSFRLSSRAGYQIQISYVDGKLGAIFCFQVAFYGVLYIGIDLCVHAYPDSLFARYLGIVTGDNLQVSKFERLDQVSHRGDGNACLRAKLNICATQEVNTDIKAFECQ